MGFLVQMREMGASLTEFENESIHYERGKGLSIKVEQSNFQTKTSPR